MSEERLAVALCHSARLLEFYPSYCSNPISIDIIYGLTLYSGFTPPTLLFPPNHVLGKCCLVTFWMMERLLQQSRKENEKIPKIF